MECWQFILNALLSSHTIRKLSECIWVFLMFVREWAFYRMTRIQGRNQKNQLNLVWYLHIFVTSDNVIVFNFRLGKLIILLISFFLRCCLHRYRFRFLRVLLLLKSFSIHCSMWRRQQNEWQIEHHSLQLNRKLLSCTCNWWCCSSMFVHIEFPYLSAVDAFHSISLFVHIDII